MDAQLDLLQDAGTPSGARWARRPLAPARRGPAAATSELPGPRLGELLCAMSPVLDLADGQPAGHALRSCWIGQRLGRALGLGVAQLGVVWTAMLLKDAGGSSDSARLSQAFLADDLRYKRHRRTIGLGLPSRLGFVLRHAGASAAPGDRLRAIVDALQNGDEIERELTEARGARGAQVARQLGLGDDVADAIQALGEHWDGSGQPQGLAGDEIPLASRIALLAQGAEAFHADAGPQAAREAVARRAGRWFEPRLADAFAVLARDPSFWRQLGADDLEQRVQEVAPAPMTAPVDDDGLDDIAAAFGQIADAKSAWTAGHSARVARAAEQMAARLGLVAPERRQLRRCALLHDLGKLGVSNLVLDKAGPLDAVERATLRQHVSSTERLLGRVGAFAGLARIAGAHHERLDGSGYPRGLHARHIRLESRIIAVADRFDALTSDRPGRPAVASSEALRRMRDEVGRRLDADCLAALEQSLDALGARSVLGAL